MVKIFRFLMSVLLVSFAALLGNWIGGLLRYILTGERVQTLQFKYTTAKGRQLTNSPVATKAYPALAFAILGKPRWLYAFIGGILAGSLVPDHLEHVWLERVIEPVFVDRLAVE